MHLNRSVTALSSKILVERVPRNTLHEMRVILNLMYTGTIGDREHLSQIIGTSSNDVFPIGTPSEIINGLFRCHYHPLFLPKLFFVSLFFLFVFPERGNFRPTFDLVPDDDSSVVSCRSKILPCGAPPDDIDRSGVSFQGGSICCSRRMRGYFKSGCCIDVWPNRDIWMYSPNSDATIRSSSGKPIDPRCRSIKTASRCGSACNRGRFGHRYRARSSRCCLGCRSGGRRSNWSAHSILNILGPS